MIVLGQWLSIITAMVALFTLALPVDQRLVRLGLVCVSLCLIVKSLHVLLLHSRCW